MGGAALPLPLPSTPTPPGLLPLSSVGVAGDAPLVGNEEAIAVFRESLRAETKRELAWWLQEQWDGIVIQRLTNAEVSPYDPHRRPLERIEP